MPGHEQLLCVLQRVFHVEVVVAEGRTSHSRLGTGPASGTGCGLGLESLEDSATRMATS
jgi:hypothetical protein